MDRFYGFDLGDAESAVSRLGKNDKDAPKILPVRERGSFITAYAKTADGGLLIGESACTAPGALERRLRFKSRFLTDPEAENDIRRFAAGVLGELYQNGDLVRGSDDCFYIGCPAGWGPNDRERYREIFERTGYPPVRIISESRAALVSSCQSRHLQIGHDILSRPVLVVDIGSSTTDFAYIMSGREVELRTAGEVFLGGGIMDELLLDMSVVSSGKEAEIRRIFSQNEPWRTYCEFAARRLKERYFSDEAYWKEHECTDSILLRRTLPLRLKLRIDEKIADDLLHKETEKLGGRSFEQVFLDSLADVRTHIGEKQPELLFLTGGVSRMPAVRKWCEKVFPEAVIITGTEPEFSVARGLAYTGRIDEELREFHKDIEELKASSAVEDIVQRHIGDLYHRAVDSLVEPILEKAALPVFDRWRDGGIARLSDVDDVMEREITAFLKSEEARDLLHRPIAAWLRPVAEELEQQTVPICIRHNVPYRALSLTSYLAVSDIDIHVDARGVFAVQELTLFIDTVISVIAGLLCGGGGIALIANGIPGIITGVIVSFLLLILGKNRMETALLSVDLPGPMRRLVPRRYFRSRLKRISAEVKRNVYESLEKEKNEEITDRMVSEISLQIEMCLSKMAEIVEIPLG